MIHRLKLTLSLAAVVLASLPCRAVDVSRDTHPRPESVDGLQVDTATGAFTEGVALANLSGSRSLSLGLSYNSMLGQTYGDAGYGWSHQYEGRVVGDPRGRVSVFLNRSLKNDFVFVGEGQPYRPLDQSNRYDVLERTSSEGVNFWTLKRLGGTTYIFAGLDQAGGASELAALSDHNGNAIDVEREGGKIVKLKEASGLELALTYDLGGLLHKVYDGLHHTYLKYDQYQRLSRVYDPIKESLLNLVGRNTLPVQVPFSATTPVDYPIAVSLPADRARLFLLRGSVTFSDPDVLQVSLISPQGSSVPVKITPDGYYVTDAFLNENPSGIWKVRIINRSLATPGETATINNFELLTPNVAANWTQYEYDAFPFNHIVRASDSLGQRLYSNTYDSAGRIAFQDDGRDSPGSGGWEYRYQSMPGGDLLTTVYDRTPARNQTEYLHNSKFCLKRVKDALSNQTLHGYNPSGDRVVTIDARGNRTTFAYDARGNLIARVAPGARTTTFGYDERNNLTRVTDALNTTTTFEYDERNYLTGSSNADAEVQTQVYDGSGKITGSINKDSAAIIYSYQNELLSAVGAIGEEEVKYARDALGRVTSITDPSGNVSVVIYDSRGNIISRRNALNHTRTSEFDHRNRLVSEKDVRGGISRYEYDGNDNVIRIVNPLGEAMTFEYDAEDRLTGVIDAAGTKSTTVYDAVGRVVELRNLLGTSASYSYDEVGNRTEEFGANGERLALITYNEVNLPTRIEDPLGRVELFTYDLMGTRTSATDLRGKTTTFERDKMGRVVKVTDPLGRQSRHVFSSDDVLEKIVYAGGQETSFTYTETNQVKSITTPGSFTTQFEYNDDGKIVAFTPPDPSKRLEYTYDADGRRILRRTLSPLVPETHYEYDEAGNVTTISTKAGGAPLVRQISRSFDSLNREVSAIDADGKQIRRVYNSAGLVSQLIYPDSKTVSYTYDAGKRMSSVTDWANRVTQYRYNSSNDITEIQFPNGTSRVMTYDTNRRLLKRTDYGSDGSVIVSYDYAYDATGFVSSRIQAVDPVVFAPTASNFSYDGSNRLTVAKGVAINHDLDGNMTRGVVAGQPENISWDYYQNLSNAGSLTCSYNAEDRLSGWQDGAGSTKFTILETGRGSKILVNESSTGSTTRYVYGVGLAYEEIDGQIRVLHYDEMGNTVALSDATGQVSGTIAYSPYGETIDSTGESGTIFKYGGLFGVVTAPNGLINMRFRWYSPEMRRFLSLDSQLGELTSPLTLNRYIYAGGNPINFNDPGGEWFGVDDLVAIGVGFVAGVVGEVGAALINGETPDWRDALAAGIGGGLASWGTLYGPAGMVAAGAAGGAAEYLVRTGLRDAFPMDGDDPALAKFNATTLGVFAAAGAGGGAIGAGFARVAKAGADRALRQGLLKNAIAGASSAGGRRGAVQVTAKQVAAAGAKSMAERSAKKEAAKEFIKLVLIETGIRQFRGKRYGSPAVTWGKETLGFGGGSPGGNDEKKSGSLQYPVQYVGKGGEYRHMGIFKEALSAACRPFPDNNSGLFPF